MQTIIIPQDGNGRLDRRLSQHYSFSRNFFHHIFSRGGIFINNRQAKKSDTVKPGDQISIDNLERFCDGSILDEAVYVDIPIMKETNDYIVVHKPSGILSHPGSMRDLQTPSVVAWLYHHYKNLPSYGNFVRAGLIHRLDKETEGLMICVKTERGLAHFKTLFQKKSVAPTITQKESVPLKKFYRAHSIVTEQGKEFIEQIKTFPHLINIDVRPNIPHATIKMGITKILSITRIDKHNVICDIEILTGRTHQIRYHLSHYGLPIIGDYLYGKKDDKPLGLCAYRLIFEDPDGEVCDIKITSSQEKIGTKSST